MRKEVNIFMVSQIEEMTKEISYHLTEVLIPFWEKLKDEKSGGYYGFMDHDLKLDHKAVKGCILNSRILWFFSNAYTLLGEESLKEHAAHAYHFLKQAFWDREYGGVYWAVDYSGQPVDDTKHTYNMSFAIYALSSYYEASKDQEALSLAMDLFHTVETKCKDDFGYREAFDRQFREMDNVKLSGDGILAEKTMNTLLHVFEAYTELYRVSKEEEVRDSIMWILDLFAGKVYNPSKHRLEVFFDREMNTLADLHSLGHDIEAAWLIRRGVEVIGRKDYRQKMYPVTKDLVQEIYRHLSKEGGLAEEDGTKKSYVWWVQAETVVGFWDGWELERQKTEYLNAAYQTWKFILKYIWDSREGGEWHAEVKKDGSPIDKPEVEPWKCPYHNGRMCFELIKRSRKTAL